MAMGLLAMIEFKECVSLVGKAEDSRGLAAQEIPRNIVGLRTVKGLRQHATLMLLGFCAIGECMDSTSVLLAKYKSATCISPSTGASRERRWETTISLRDGSKVVVGAAAWAGGRAIVTYPPAPQEYVAAQPGDYIYPVDLRIDTKGDILYVAASGLAGGLFEQTWLFAFDLKERRQIARRKIRYKDLPAVCSGPERAR
jgi:hypothetical protein